MLGLDPVAFQHALGIAGSQALDGLAAIMKENDLAAQDIAAVDVGLSKMTHVHGAWEYKAQGVTAAQMNLFFCMALTAHEGKVITAQFDPDRLSDPRLLDFITRVTATIDPEIEGMGAPFRHAARVIGTDGAGRRHEKLVLHRRGSPENPLTPADIEYKFRNVVSRYLSDQKAERLVALVSQLEALPDLREVLAIPF
jgi:2-methylcitrate dehydratase PrpD